jgi:hypothetical protein
VLPAFAIIAEPAISDANRTTTVPLADGTIIPSITAIFPATAAELALQAAGELYVVAKLSVCVVAVNE